MKSELAGFRSSGMRRCVIAASGSLFRNVGNSLPLTRRHTPEDLHPLKYRLENLEYRNSLTSLAAISFSRPTLFRRGSCVMTCLIRVGSCPSVRPSVRSFVLQCWTGLDGWVKFGTPYVVAVLLERKNCNGGG